MDTSSGLVVRAEPLRRESESAQRREERGAYRSPALVEVGTLASVQGCHGRRRDMHGLTWEI